MTDFNVQSQPVSNIDIQRKIAWFCVAQTTTGEIFRKETENPNEFISVLANAQVGWVDFIANDFEKEAPTAAAKLGFTEELFLPLIKEQLVTYRDLNNEIGMKLPSIQVRDFMVLTYPMVILMRKNFVLTVHPQNVDRRLIRLRRYAETFMKKIPASLATTDKLATVLLRIIDINNESNFRHLREIEETGDSLNRDLVDPNTPRSMLGPKIYEMKHALIEYLDGLWHTMDVIHTLRWGDADLITDDQVLLDRIEAQADATSTQIGLAEHMSEVLSSGLEVMQSIYNNQLQILNNRLAMVVAYLTIIGTAFLVPNTIATIMSNAAFEMGPERQVVVYFTHDRLNSTGHLGSMVVDTQNGMAAETSKRARNQI